ncbi:MAG TPA: tetratricopeptide repeat protein [Methylomirabilota bacterium]|nr:tetratricopeptide repeat protein [Methylomirabilota bacterium]
MRLLHRWGLPSLVATLCFAVFIPSLDGQFLNWDDQVNFVSNPGYRGLGLQQIRWMLTTTLMGHWIPLTWLSFGVNYALGGMDPWGYHLGNLLLHAANAVLFYLVARRLLAAAEAPHPFLSPSGEEGVSRPPLPSGDRAGLRGDGRLNLSAGFAALLFAVHPLRVESVAWITERRDVLCGLFFLLAILAYLRGTEGSAPIRPGWRALSLLAFAAALLSKAAAMPLPAVLLLLDIYPLRRAWLGWKRLILEKLPWAALAAGAAAIALFALPRGGWVTTYEQYGPVARLAMAAYSFAFYPRKFLWPSDLIPLYELPVLLDPLQWRFVGSAIAVLGVTLALWLARRRWPAGLGAWVYSALMILPVSGIVHSGHQLAHDRYSYLSGLGFALLAGSGALWVLGLRAAGRVGRPVTAVLGVAASAAVLGLGVASWSQSYLWRDSESLWRWAVEMDAACSICRLNLGAAILKDDPRLAMARIGEGEALFREAIRLRPSYAEAYYNLSLALMAQKRYDEAEQTVETLIRLGRGGALVPELLGLLYFVQGRYAQAVAPLRQAAAMRGASPRMPVQAGQDPVREALALLQDNPRILTYAGSSLVEAGRPAHARLALERALALDPNAAAARYWLVRAYLAEGARAEADRELALLRAAAPELAARAMETPPASR